MNIEELDSAARTALKFKLVASKAPTSRDNLQDLEPPIHELHELEAVSDLIDAEVAAVNAECELLAAVDRFVQASRNVFVLRQEFPVVWS